MVELDFVFEEVFEAVPSLKFVGTCRAATSHVDIEAATANGVAVVNTPARNAQAVAEHALGLMLSLARRIPEGHRYVTGGRWLNPVEPYVEMRGVELGGPDAGHRGTGGCRSSIGRDGEGDRHDVRRVTILTWRFHLQGVRLKQLDEVLEGSDFVSIHTPLTGETQGLIDSRGLSLMKPDGVPRKPFGCEDRGEGRSC